MSPAVRRPSRTRDLAPSGRHSRHRSHCPASRGAQCKQGEFPLKLFAHRASLPAWPTSLFDEFIHPLKMRILKGSQALLFGDRIRIKIIHRIQKVGFCQLDAADHNASSDLVGVGMCRVICLEDCFSRVNSRLVASCADPGSGRVVTVPVATSRSPTFLKGAAAYGVGPRVGKRCDWFHWRRSRPAINRQVAAMVDSARRRATTINVIWSQITPPICRTMNSMRGPQGGGTASPRASIPRCRKRWAPVSSSGRW
jgi:hypothetical protein